MLGAIERERQAPRNPSIPDWLASGYEQAWRDIIELALRDLERSADSLLVQSALGVVAMARGLRRAAEILLDFTEDELEEMIARYRGDLLLALVIVVCLPLILLLLLAYGLFAVLLHILLWIFWSPAGKRVLFVYSNSPVWQSYIEDRILPKLPHGSVVLNWSERRHWQWWSLSAAVFHFFGGGREFNPLAIAVRPLRWVRVFRFWRAFRDAKHGDRTALHLLETQFFAYLGIPDQDAAI